MVEAIRSLRTAGWSIAALTNNWVEEGEREPHELATLFDAFVESAVVGLRKPDPRIYELVCSELSVGPHQAIFLDDIGRNLKAARALGMHTIKVDAPDRALAELSEVTGLRLG